MWTAAPCHSGAADSHSMKSDRRAAPIVFGPRTLRRTWGTRPISSDRILDRIRSNEGQGFKQALRQWLLSELQILMASWQESMATDPVRPGSAHS
jgi:hypothetical protein